MKLSKYIGDLLFEHECVVIPGLGGFITNDIPAKIQNDKRTFNPPAKKIVFNVFLKTNDGLLINKLAELENISYSDSKLKVEKFVEKCYRALHEKKKINFQNVGILFFDEEKNINFEQDLTQNYLAESFGMTSFISPPIRRETTRHKIEKTFIDRKPKQKQAVYAADKNEAKQEYETLTAPAVKRPRYISINVFSLLIIAGIIFLGVRNPARVNNLYNSYSNFVPFFFTTPNEYVIKNIPNIPLEKILSEKNTNSINSKKINESEKNKNSKNLNIPKPGNKEIKIKATEKEESPVIKNKASIINNKPINKTEKSKAQSPKNSQKKTISNPGKNHYIVAGSFKKLSNAKNLIRKLNNEGYESEIIGRNKYGWYRVSYSGFSTIADAREELAIIKKTENPSVWIFSK